MTPEQQRQQYMAGVASKVRKGRYIDYVVDMAEYTSDQQIESLCNSIQFINTGTMPVLIKSASLVPGAGINIDGNYGEFDVTTYDIQFPNITANIAAGLTASLTVIRKVYSDNPGAVFQQYGPKAAYNL